jgi:hypothetical protein
VWGGGGLRKIRNGVNQASFGYCNDEERNVENIFKVEAEAAAEFHYSSKSR